MSTFLSGVEKTVAEANKLLAQQATENNDPRLYQLCVERDDCYPPIALNHKLFLEVTERKKE